EQDNKDQQDLLTLDSNYLQNGAAWFSNKPLKLTPKAKTAVHVGPMVKLWLTPADQEERLLAARLVKIGDQEICQGIVLDWAKLQEVLSEVVKEDFPEAQLKTKRKPIPERSKSAMTHIPMIK